MSWSRALALGVLLASTGCGFRPLYGEHGAAESARIRLEAVEIAPIPDRVGQVVRNHLRDLLTPRGRTAAPMFRLDVALEKTTEGLAFARDDTVTRFSLTLAAHYDLVELASGRPLVSGRTRSIAAYNVVESDYATIAAARDAEARVARAVSEEIALRLAVYLGAAPGASP
ncbi:MAG: hypothetical protein FJX56_07635 [Alphaproteobacteria bacterium]|nr:hypothetical protein [Alphaproteobacteria bacterium]